jgi:hypothetical protein
VWDLCTTPPTTDRQRLQSDIAELVTSTGQTIGSVDVGALINSLTAVIYENRLVLPPGVMLLLRMLGELRDRQTAQSAVRPVRIDQAVYRGAARRRLAKRVWLRCSAARGRGASAALDPGDLNDMLASMRARTLSVHLDQRLDPVVNRWCWACWPRHCFWGDHRSSGPARRTGRRRVSVFGAVSRRVHLGVTCSATSGTDHPPEDR